MESSEPLRNVLSRDSVWAVGIAPGLVFVCHSSADHDKARQPVQHLESAGVRCAV